MRKTITAFLSFCFWMAVFCLPAAAANHIPKMEIDAALGQDGSAVITQVWTADTDEGTEFYLSCHDSGYLRITDFSVSDESGTYTFLEDWNPDASFGEKAGKCGILKTEDGVELCWGISRYGHRRYTITYVLHDLVGAYFDADGFNHRFVDDMSTFPTDVVLTIRNEDGTPLTGQDCRFWAFGYDGQIQLENGTIRTWSETALDSGQHMTIMVSLDKGLLSPLRNVDGNFEDVKERAFEGSDYKEEQKNFFGLLLGIAPLFLACVSIALAAVFASRLQKVRLRRRMRQVRYFRDAPNNGNLNVTHRLASACGLCKEDSLPGVYILRLISSGSLEPEKVPDASPQVDLRLVRPPGNGNPYDEAFYAILERAAGTDGVLHASELERFCSQNSKPLADFVDSCRQDADRTMIRSGCYHGAVCQGVKSLTQKGRKELDEILGLKRFLLDFSLIQERGVEETVIWQDYMIYAYLLGIADEVAPQIHKLYPKTLPQVERFQQYIGYAKYYNGFMCNACFLEGQRQTIRSAGRGGMASLGGGGGFSGGGGGGIR